MKPKYDFDDIKNQYTGDINLLYALLPGGIMRGAEFRCGSINGEPGDSLGYNTTTGIWADFASGHKGGSIVDLVMAVKQFTNPADAAAWILENKGVAPTKQRQQKKGLTQLNIAPRGIPAPTTVYVDGKNEAISNAWAYHDALGDVLMYDVRVDRPDGSKLVLPMHWEGGRWALGTIAKDRPLYNLHKIPDASKIVVVEGCKTADALSQYLTRTCVITWQGGCNGVDNTDWTPVSGRQVIIVPDADNKDGLEWEQQPGMKAALNIANKLKKQGCTIKIVDTSSMATHKDGWDFADALAEGWDKQRVLDFIADNSKPFGKTKLVKDEVFMAEEVEVVIKEKNPNEVQYKDEYFKCLGYNDGMYFYYVKATGLLHTLKPTEHNKQNLISLAPLSFWEAYFSKGKSGVDWLAAADEFMRVQERVGMYDESRVRGRGAWLDEGRIVLHIGDKLVVDGVPMEVHAFSTRYLYERRPRIHLPLQTMLPDEWSAKLIDLYKMPRWRRPYYGEILAGWVFSSLICGVFPMRTHLYIDGEKKAGKSWLINNLILPVLGDNKLAVEGATTEAGIREALRADVLPVIFDESEGEQQNDKIRLQGVFNLARAAATSNGATILKGSVNGKGLSRYTCRSAFLFASINVSMTQSADISRTITVSLRGKPHSSSPAEVKEADFESFAKMSEFAATLLKPDYCRCLFTRAIKLADNMLRTQRVISDVATKRLGDKRLGDQLGMIGAGVWHLQHQQVASEKEAQDLIEKLKIADDVMIEEDDNLTCLQWLFAQDISINISGMRQTLRLVSLISEISKSTECSWANKELLLRELKSAGIDVKNGELYLATSSALYPARMFAKSMFGANGWRSALKRIPGVRETTGNQYFCQYTVSKALVIPLEKIEHLGNIGD